MDLFTGAAATTVIVTIAVYLAVMLLVGFLAGRFAGRSITHFFLGGRVMKDWVVALSAVASGRSAWLLLGLSGTAYLSGLPAIWALPGYILAELWMFWQMGVRLRRFTGAGGDITVPDYLESRFGDRTHLLRIASVVLFFIFVAPYLAAQFSAGGKIFHSAAGLDPLHGIVITAAIVLIYTVAGGFLGVSLTDVLQSFLMILALLVLPAWAVISAGGIGAVVSQLGGLEAALTNPWALGVGATIGLIGIGFGSPGSPHILVRHMSIEHPRMLRRAALLGTVWNVLMGWGAIWIGLCGRFYFGDPSVLPAGDKEYIFPLLAGEFFPPILFGLMVSAVLAAIMSTADSQALIVASGVVRDVIQKLTRWGAGLSERALVTLSRIVVLVLVLAGLIWSVLGQQGIIESETVFWLVLLAWSGLGASIGPVMILSLYWRRMTAWGALAGMLTGAVVTLVWDKVEVLNSAMYELVPAFILACIAIWIVSLLTQPRPESLQRFDERMGGGSS
jgi:sodium/proline symporter